MADANKRAERAGIAASVLVIASIVVGLVVPKFVAGTSGLMISWGAITILLALIVSLIGRAIRPDLGLSGWLVTERNVASLAHFQFALWTVVIFSGLGCILLANVARHPDPDLNPLAISIPKGLWALAGITTASYGARAVIAGSFPARFRKRTRPQQWSLRDLVTSDRETGDPANSGPALSKTQMLFLTLIVATAYYIAIGGVLASSADGETIAGLPDVSQGLDAMLAISHAAYAGVKLPWTGDSPA